MKEIGEYAATHSLNIKGQNITFHWKKIDETLYYDLYNNGGLNHDDIEMALKKAYDAKKIEKHYWGGWASW